jgi:hypothetical protein
LLYVHKRQIMARPSTSIIQALRNTARRIEKSATYQWGHMGLCNCGFLAQEVTNLRKEEIHRSAMQGHGDWSEQLNDYCPTSGLPMDDLISALLRFGFDSDDLKHLEKLNDPKILAKLPNGRTHLIYNLKADVVCYLLTWADLLEAELLEHVMLPSYLTSEVSIL